jgi:hypothetical protein
VLERPQVNHNKELPVSDVLEAYLHFTEETEPPTQFHRWSFLSGVAACLGRRVWIPFSHGRIYPNMYVMIVGVPGTRKSTAINICRNIVKDSGYCSFGFTKTTKEKFLLDFEEGFTFRSAKGDLEFAKLLEANLHPEDGNEVYINCDEFVDFIGQGNVNFINLLTTLWDNLPEYQERLKNSKSVSIPSPTVNLLGGITPTSLASAMPPEVIGQGFMSRIILVYSDPTRKKITFPPPPDEIMRGELVKFFTNISQLHGEMKISNEARFAIDKIYKEWPQLADIRLQYYGARRLTHLLKLCMILAACDGIMTISDQHVFAANTILTWTERKMHMALGEFGESRNAKAAQKIVEVLANAPEPVSAITLWKAVSMDLERSHQLQELLNNLRSAGKIEMLTMASEVRIKLKVHDTTDKRYGVFYDKYIAESQVEPDDHLELTDDLSGPVDDSPSSCL